MTHVRTMNLALTLALATVFAALFAFAVAPQAAQAETEEVGNDLIITPDEGEEWTYIGELRSWEKGTKKDPAVITVKPGKYYVPRTFLQSYTTINAKGATFRSTSSGGFFVGGEDYKYKKKKGYTHLTNVTINGGTWECRKSNSLGTMMKVSHAKKIKFKNFTIKNCYGTHFIEWVGVSDSSITNVKLTGAYTLKDNTNEAIQLDNCLNSTVAPDCEPHDGTPCKNIKIKNCTIKVPKMPVGIGTNYACKKKSTNIKIIGCNIKTKIYAISLVMTNKTQVKNCKFHKSNLRDHYTAVGMKTSGNKYYRK